jgi:outer membrane lipoprotein-sorting protein
MTETTLPETDALTDLSRRRLLAMLPAAALFPLSLLGSGPAAAQMVSLLPPKDRELVDQIADYLQRLTTAKASFFQTNDRGGAADGTLYLDRPGKARFEYSPSAGLLIVADGKRVSVYDSKLKTFDSYALAATPLALLLSRKVRLDGDVMVTRVSRSEGGVTLTLRDARREAEGFLLLEFKLDPIALTGWTVVDTQNRRTVVKLGPLESTGGFDPALFVLKDPGKKPK